MQLLKVPHVDEERLDDEVILLHRGTLSVKILNETAAVLWDALEEFPTITDLTGLLEEARPEISRTECLEHVATFVDELAGAGFVERQERG